MNQIKPDMWGKARFIVATTPPIKRKSFAALDRQLALWDSHKNNPAESAFYLVTVIEQCAAWQAAKATKMANNPTKNVLKRNQQVATLRRMAFERLRWESFQAKKNVGAKAAAKPLESGYAAERNQFLAGKARGVATSKGGEFNPKGGSFVHESQDSMVRNAPADIPAHLLAAMNSSFDTLSDADFLALHDYFSSPAGALYAGMQRQNVHFARKDERIETNMIVPIRGVYHRNTGDTPYTTAGLDIYAMDKYGNLMVQSSGAFHGAAHTAAQYNHSSLNAGNDVICAGTCVIQNGVIQHIDNESGHYKPGRAQMHALVRVLKDDDMADLTFATLKIKSAAGDQYFRGLAINTFYANYSAVGTPN
jgi:cytochrome c553